MNSVGPKQRAHIPQVDYIRAIASLAVAVFHMSGKTMPVLKYGRLGVQMFFLLSGFIICWAIPDNYSLSSTGKFIARRITRIEPPYVVSVIMAVIAHFWFVQNYHPDWTNIFLHFGYLNTYFDYPYLNPVYWTLAIEFQFYVLIAFIFPVLRKRFGFVIVLFLCNLGYFITGKVGLVNAFPIFAMGIFYYLYKTKSINKATAITSITAVALFAFIKVGTLETAGALFALLILMLPLKGNRIVLFFSQISFSLYLTHDIIGSNIIVILGTIFPKEIFYKGCVFMIGLIASIGFAYLFYLVLERPFLRLSKKIKYSN